MPCWMWYRSLSRAQPWGVMLVRRECRHAKRKLPCGGRAPGELLAGIDDITEVHWDPPYSRCEGETWSMATANHSPDAVLLTLEQQGYGHPADAGWRCNG